MSSCASVEREWQNLSVSRFASLAVSSGASLPLVGSLLGHTQPSTTQRYAHLLDAPQRALVDKVAETIGVNILPPPDNGRG